MDFNDLEDKWLILEEDIDKFIDETEGYIIGLLNQHGLDEFVFKNELSEIYSRCYIKENIDSLMLEMSGEEKNVLNFAQGICMPVDAIRIAEEVAADLI